MSQLSEQIPVEARVTQWLSKMGWSHKTPAELKVYNRPYHLPYIIQILKEKVEAFNHGISENAINNAITILCNHLENNSPIEGNEAFLNALCDGVTISDQGNDRTIKFIDFENIWNNSFIVTNQYTVRGQAEVRTDIVLLVNGLPLVPIEAKQCARRGTNWLEGVCQFSTYDQRAARLFITHVFGVACNGRIAKYGIPGASSSYYNEWKDTTLDMMCDNPILDPHNDLCPTHLDENDGFMHFDVERLSNGEPLEKMKLTIVGLLQPARVLDILQHFIVFQRDNESHKIIKKVARYQQLRAANKIADRVVNTNYNRGVIWHTQGSGKSLTMLYTAYKLRLNPSLNDPTIYLVLDRKDLRDQLGDTFSECVFPNVRPVNDIADLKWLIDTHPAGVYISTIQKFDELGQIKDDRENVIVLIDEAHRTQYGEYQMELQAALPNAKIFAFTGTPIPKTHKEFGIKFADGKYEYYLDKYSIQDAIDDGATKKVRYTFGPTDWQLDKDKLAEGYAELTAELTEEQKKLVEKRVRPWAIFMKKPERIATLAKDIAEDFRQYLEPNGLKAQVVAIDKEACVLYYRELLKYFDSSELQIIFSTGQYEESARYQMFKDFYIDDNTRKRYIKNFKKRITDEEREKGNNLKIFIVCNMLLTGFDAPIEQTMYLDSPLRDHTLLQAIARTNRPYDDKETKVVKQFGRIVDYVGVFQNYKEALCYDPEDIGEFEDVDSLAKTFPNVLKEALEPFADITLENSYECFIAILRRLSEIDHGKFENSFHEVMQLWEAICPNPIIRPYRAQYHWLITIYELYLEEFRRLDFDADIYAAKTRELIQECSTVLNFRGHLPEIEIDSDYINKLNETKLTPEDKAEKIIRDIETVIRINKNSSSIYVEYQKRLDDLIKRKAEENHQIEEILQRLSELYNELDDVASLPQRMGFDDRGTFELFTLIRNAHGEISDTEKIKSLSKAISNRVHNKVFIGWQEMPREVKKIKYEIQLLMAGDEFADLAIDEDDELVESLLNATIRYYALN